jgi:hypothetical protein
VGFWPLSPIGIRKRNTGSAYNENALAHPSGRHGHRYTGGGYVQIQDLHHGQGAAAVMAGTVGALTATALGGTVALLAVAAFTPRPGARLVASGRRPRA